MKYPFIIGILLTTFLGIFAANMENSLEPWDSDLEFSHLDHINDNDAVCKDCHPEAYTSTTGTDDLLPKEAYCMECHEKDEETCSDCHNTPTSPKLLPRIINYSSKFNHKKHLDEGYTCEKCHAGVELKESISGMHMPTMNNCMECHDVTDNKQDCYLCHTQNEDLKPIDHTGLWNTIHGSFSESSGKDCASCHTESYCMDCHLGENLFSESHPPEFIMTHSFSYMTRESDCVSCHGGYDYCIECHTQVNYVVPMDHYASDWITTGHPTESKINMDLCVTCHTKADQEQAVCMLCHTK